MKRSEKTESRYSVSELADRAELFGTRPECVVAALKGLELATEEQARRLIAAFLERKV